MAMAAEMSERLGWLQPAARDRVVRLLKRLGLPTDAPRIGAQRGRELMGMDKKVLAGRIRLVLLEELGRAVVVDDYAEQAFDATLQAHFG
jgi:3-dehydroquinate synthase